MKKLMLFAAALVALAACNKENGTDPKPQEGCHFAAGQKVDLSLGISEASKAKTEGLNFVWETGDKILVTVGGQSAQFSLTAGAGTSSGKFSGTMPAEGDQFDVQYPVSTPDLSSQSYNAGGLPSGKMLATATGCTLDNPFSLTPQYAGLKLNFYGLNREVSKIVVTNTATSASYTLNCGTAVRVSNSSSKATAFYIVVPAGSWNFKVEVIANDATSDPDPIPTYTEGSYTGNGIVITTGLFSTSSAQSFVSGQILDMPAKLISAVWAPVNCGYEAKSDESLGYPYGKLYQWGRKYGQGYKASTYEDADYPGKAGGNQFLVDSSSPQTSHPDGVTYNGNFYHDSSGTIFNWYGGSDPDKLWNSNEGTSDPVAKSEFDPCPNGWRVPTESELTALIGSHTEGALQDGSGVHSGMKGKYFDGSTAATPTSGVFLPATGYRRYDNGVVRRRGDFGYCWSSSVDGNLASRLYFRDGSAIIEDNSRAYGFSVRCIKE